jgi:hypothetical protein
MEKEKARQALAVMHEHLSRQFPQACPIDLDRPAVQPESRGVPPTAGIGKSADGDGDGTLYYVRTQEGVTTSEGVTYKGVSAPPVAASLKADPEDGDLFADAEVYKGFKKMRKKLGKKVLSGKMTVDEARTHLGRQFAQKGTDEPQEAVQKSAEHQHQHPQGGPTFSQAVAPLLEKIREQDETYTTKLAETQRVIDAIADQPDPSTAAFSGLAFNPLHTKAARPAGVPAQAEIAERTQNMVMRTLQDKYNSSSDPTEREAYYSTLARMRGYSEP